MTTPSQHNSRSDSQRRIEGQLPSDLFAIESLLEELAAEDRALASPRDLEARVTAMSLQHVRAELPNDLEATARTADHLGQAEQHRMSPAAITRVTEASASHLPTWAPIPIVRHRAAERPAPHSTGQRWWSGRIARVAAVLVLGLGATFTMLAVRQSNLAESRRVAAAQTLAKNVDRSIDEFFASSNEHDSFDTSDYALDDLDDYLNSKNSDEGAS